MSNPPGNKVHHFMPDDKDIRVTFLLKGEEATEFKRFLHKQNIKAHLGGKILLLEGLKKRGYLPEWWRIK